MDAFDKIIKETPLDTRLKVLNQLGFIELITELGYRESKYWTDEENELLNNLYKLANQHTDRILDVIKEWEEDGKP